MIVKIKYRIKSVALPFVLLVLLVVNPFYSNSQVDRRFWFVVPELSHRGGTGGTPAILKISTLELPATVTVSMPANPYDPISGAGFQNIVINIAGNSTYGLDLSYLVDDATNPTRNLLENKPLSLNGINNYGLLITSDNFITAYWEVAYTTAADLWVLKGTNGLGTRFYTPFQTFLPNRTYDPVAYSAIDIVSAADGNVVTITVPPGKRASYGLLPTTTGVNETFQVTLNKGQTFSLFPENFSPLESRRLAGTYIESTDSIAVIVKDDALEDGNNGRDIIGDQLIPIRLLGDTYIVTVDENSDYIYVLTTEDNTTIRAYRPDGILHSTVNIPVAGTQVRIQQPNNIQFLRITAEDPTKPFYIFHVAYEIRSYGGAVLPAINDCTGNTQVSFSYNRYSEIYNQVSIILLVKKGLTDALGNDNRHRFLVDGVRNDGIIDPTKFVPIIGSGTGVNMWYGYWDASTNMNTFTQTQHLISNTGGVFHFGMRFGKPGGGGRIYYGYFSDYGNVNVGASTSGTTSTDVLVCHGYPVQLYAYGGTNYEWIPEAYLDDPTSNMPVANNLPSGFHRYKVHITGDCADDTITINITVFPEIHPFFGINKVSGCSVMEVDVTDQSTGSVNYWRYRIYNWDKSVTLYDQASAVRPPPFQWQFTNNSDSIEHYYIDLLVRNESGCSQYYTRTITVFPSISASFQPDIDLNGGCDNPFDVTFTNQSSSNTVNTYIWDFGDGFGHISNIHDEVVSHSFHNTTASPQTYNVQLLAISPYGCRDSSDINVTVTSFFQPYFDVNKTSGCADDDVGGLSVRVVNASQGDIASATWSISPVVPFSFPGLGDFTDNFLPNNTGGPLTYTIKLVVQNIDGCKDSLETQVTVYPDVHAAFTPSIMAVCNGSSIIFTNGTLPNLNPGFNYSYTWAFGDGAGTTLTSPSHTYSHIFDTPQNYTVSLNVMNPWGCTDQTSQVITVYSRINAEFTLLPSFGCSPLTVNLDNNSFGHATNVSYLWNFGDGSPTSNLLEPGSHIYVNNGTLPANHTLTLTLTNEGSCTDSDTEQITVYPKVNNTLTQSDIRVCDSTVVSYTANILPVLPNISHLWSFGDGNSASGSPVSNLYRNLTGSDVVNNVTLVSTSEYGCNDVETTTLTVSPYTKALFTVSKNSICSGESITFNYLRPAGVSSYSWVFDGYTDQIKPPDSPLGTFSKTFINHTGVSMNITVRLTVDNNHNCPKVFEVPITIYPAVTAIIAADDTEDCDGIEVNFTNSSVLTGTAIPPGNYFWDFGDGSNTFEFEPSHVFYNPSSTGSVTYTVTHTASNSFGCSDQATINITVYPRIAAGFSLEKATDCSPFDVRFIPASEGAATYIWNFGGALTPNVETFNNGNPFTRRFENPNPNDPVTYTVTLEVQNALGVCSRTFSRDVLVQPRVVASFAPNITIGCSDLVVRFDNLSTGGNLTFDWDFDDGQSATTLSTGQQFHTFVNRESTDRNFLVSLTARNPQGCSNTLTRTVIVHPKVEANFVMTYDDTCTPFDVNLKNSSLNGDSFEWDFDATGLLGAPSPIVNNNQEFSRVFDNPNPNLSNEYTLKLVASQYYTLSNLTCRDTVDRKLIVLPRLVPNFSPDEPIGCSDHHVEFTNLTTGGTPLSFQWEFGNGESTSTGLVETNVNETYVYRGDPSIPIGFEEPTKYPVVLTATNSKGCVRAYSDTISVYPKVEAGFTFTYTDYCTPFPVQFLNSSVNGKVFEWDYGYSLSGTPQRQTTQRPTLDHTYTFDNETANDIMVYPITMVARTEYSNYTCTDTSRRNITVYPRVVANFAPDVFSGCNPLTVTFTNSSTGLGSYVWDMGDGTGSISSSTTFSRIYSHIDKTQSISYPVTLTATNVNGCKDTHSETVVVFPLVVASFNATNISGCTPLTINAINTSLSTQYNYVWEIGDGRDDQYTPLPGTNGDITYTNSTNNKPIVLYPELKLKTSYIGDPTCVDSTSKLITVYPHIYPDFETDYDGCHPHSASFVNLTDAFSINTTYHWAFGDGTISMQTNPNYQFKNPSFINNFEYSVRLDATSEHGCTDFVTKTVTVYPKPRSILELVGESLSCPPFEAELMNLSLGSNLTNYYNFGDGAELQNTTTANVTHVFTNPYSEIQPYQITLRVVTEHGCDDASSQTVYVFPDVLADFEFDPGNQACNPFLVTMENASTNALFYYWDFDNGFTSNVSQPIHRFVNNTVNDRVFDVNLIAYSEYDCSDTITKPLTVFAAPVAAFVVDPPLQTYPNTTFGINHLTQPKSPNWSYTWSFGDGYTSNVMDPVTYTYATWGPIENDFRYKISLRAASVHCWDTTSNYATILPREPIALYEAPDYEGCSPLVVNFINNSLYGHTYIWDFDDGTTSNEWEPTHTFTTPGYYNVKLVVIGDGGEHHFYHTFKVYRNPFASFSAVPDRVLLPDAIVHFFSESQFAETYLWQFGDGNVSTQKNPIHRYDALGEYNVRLTVWTAEGCQDDTLKIPGVWVTGKGQIKFPNAFVPNPNGPNGGFYDDVDFRNEVFHPYHDGVQTYRLYIFNRWGEQIFTSYDIKIGWDGYYMGKLCPQDVYVWRAIGSFANGKQFDLRGNVTLLR